MLDVNDQTTSVRPTLVQDQVDDGLEGAQCLTAPADQQPQVVTGDINHHRVLGFLDEDLGGNAHFVEEFRHHLASLDRVGLALGDAHPGFLGGFVQHLDLDVLAGFLKLLEGFEDRIVDSLAGGFDGIAISAHAAFPLPKRGGDSDPQPVMKYCWPILNRLLTTQ